MDIIKFMIVEILFIAYNFYLKFHIHVYDFYKILHFYRYLCLNMLLKLITNNKIEII